MINIPYSKQFVSSFAEFIYSNSFVKSGSFSLVSEKQIIDYSNIISQNAYARYLEKLDTEFFNSNYRKRNYKVKQIRERSLETSFGTISFKRRQYQNIKNNNYYYYIDEEILVMKKYQRLSNELIANILYDVVEFSYPQIARRYNISKQTVYNKIKDLRPYILDNISYPNKPKEIDIIYIQADECHVPKQDKKESRSTMVNTVTIHEGLKKVCNNRNKLINKTLLTKANNESNEAFYLRIYETLIKLYEYKKIYFYGDGANWIKSCAKDMDAIYFLDLFHVGQAVTRLCGIHNKDHIDSLISLIANDQKSDFKNYIKDNIDYDKMIKNDYRNKSYKYIINNWKSIQNNYSKNKSIGCSQEGLNYHHFAKRLTTLPRGFSSENTRVIAQLICCRNNNENLREMILNTIKYENQLSCPKLNGNNNNYKANNGHINGLCKSKTIRDMINETVLN